jgi:hypothetical protein
VVGVAKGNTFWEEDPVGDLLIHLCKPRPWANKVVAIAHNAKAYDLHFILNKAMLLKWQHELIMNGQKIMSVKKSPHFPKAISKNLLIAHTDLYKYMVRCEF